MNFTIKNEMTESEGNLLICPSIIPLGYTGVGI